EARVKKAPKVRPSRTREPGKRPDLPLPTPVERPLGAAGALGEKYVCYSCGAKFYDLGKPEPRCPKCGADQREAPRQTRSRPAPGNTSPAPVVSTAATGIAGCAKITPSQIATAPRSPRVTTAMRARAPASRASHSRTS